MSLFDTPHAELHGDDQKKPSLEKQKDRKIAGGLAALKKVSGASERKLSEADKAELQEQDMQRLRDFIRKEVSVYGKKKDVDSYMDHIENMILDAFEKAGTTKWHRIENVSRDMSRGFWVIFREIGTQDEITMLQLPPLRTMQRQRSRVADTDLKKEALKEEAILHESKELKTPQDLVSEALAHVNYNEVRASLDALSQASPNFPVQVARDHIDEMERGAQELARANGSIDQMIRIAQNVKKRRDAIAGGKFNEGTIIETYAKDILHEDDDAFNPQSVVDAFLNDGGVYADFMFQIETAWAPFTPLINLGYMREQSAMNAGV